MKKSPLKKKSKNKAYWERLYKKQWMSDPESVMDAYTGMYMPKARMQRHHPARRFGQNILIYCYITPEFHTWVEAHSKESRKLGWLRSEWQGYVKDSSQPRPWAPTSLINEHLLDPERHE